MDPEELENEGLAHIAPLDLDTIPNANQSHFCFSCEEPMSGMYCVACGQKNDNYRRSVFSLIKEVLASLTAIEGRIWRTWSNLLFRPGKVAREFSDGARTKWSSPVRVYLAISIMLFGFLGITNTQLITLDVNVQPKAGVHKPAIEITADELDIRPALKFFETQKQINARNKQKNFDWIALKLESGNGLEIDIGDTEDSGAPSPDTQSLSEEDDMSVILNGVEGQKEDWTGFLIDIIRNPAKVNQAFFKYLPQIMFVMMPLTMLIGALFIRGRGNALLYDHLVHSAYIHAVAFFLLLIGIILGRVLPGANVAAILFIILLFYLPLSLKRMFGRGWIKTIWTSYGVGLIYASIMILVMTGLLTYQVVSDVAPALV